MRRYLVAVGAVVVAVLAGANSVYAADADGSANFNLRRGYGKEFLGANFNVTVEQPQIAAATFITFEGGFSHGKFWTIKGVKGGLGRCFPSQDRKFKPCVQFMAGVENDSFSTYFAIQPGGFVLIPIDDTKSFRAGADIIKGFYDGSEVEFRVFFGVQFPLSRN